jgi:DNA polymerase
MMAGADPINAAGALSVLGWWRDAGVDIAIDEEPRNWLAEPAVGAPAAPRPAEKPAPAALPATLPAFRAWLEEAQSLPDGSLPGRRLLAEGDAAANIMVMLDMPEPADGVAGKLLSDETGRLLDRMLAAIGRDRGSVYLSALLLARPAGGRIDADKLPAIAALARHHIALAAPKRLLLMGSTVSRAILGTELASLRGRLHFVNHDGANVETVASFAPRFLIQNPGRKADAWKDLRLLTGGIES